MPIKTLRDALNEALHQEFERDPTVFVIGEDVAGGRGGTGTLDCTGALLRAHAALSSVLRGAG